MNPNYQYMSYSTVKKLSELIKAGAKVIVGDKPLYQSEIKQVKKTIFDAIIEEIWEGNFESYKNNGRPVYKKKLGLGQVFKAPFYGETFDALGLGRDLEVNDEIDNKAGRSYAKGIGYAHRIDGEKEIYFISNQENRKRELFLTFRKGEKSMQTFDAVSNTWVKPDKLNNATAGTSLNLIMYPNQSIFVVLDTPGVYLPNSQSAEKQLRDAKAKEIKKTVIDISKNWQAKFNTAYAGPSKPVIFNELTDWTLNVDSLVKYYSGIATYSKNFTFNGDLKGKIWIDLGEFFSIAEVKINGINCGVLWTAPHHLEISKAIKKGENQITIEVTSTWANRLIGDSKLPENKRITKTTAPFRLKGKPLNPAGLLGPVVIQVEE